MDFVGAICGMLTLFGIASPQTVMRLTFAPTILVVVAVAAAGGLFAREEPAENNELSRFFRSPPSNFEVGLGNILRRSCALSAVTQPTVSAHARQPAGWHITGSLAMAGPSTATLLKSGKVLVVGSTGAELYDPETGQWSSTGNPITPRGGHIAVQLADGKVLVAGGHSDQGVLSSAEIYDPLTGQWTTTGDLNVPRAHHTANLLADGSVLVIGGQVVLEVLPQKVRYLTYSTTEIYAPATRTWSYAGTMPSPHAHHASTSLANGNVLVIGGDEDHRNTPRAALFDPLTRTWTATGDLASGRWEPRATLLPTGKVLVAGGNNELGAETAELYDPVTGQWSVTSPMSVPRRGHTATLLPDGKVLVAGGHKDDEDYYTGNVTVLDTAELYDPATEQWSATASMNAARYGHLATLLASGKVVVAGGNVNGGGLNTAELYDAGYRCSH